MASSEMGPLQTATNEELLQEIGSRFQACVFYGWAPPGPSKTTAAYFFRGDTPTLIGCAHLLMDELTSPDSGEESSGDAGTD